MKDPLVTVVCLCYNHAAFVREALESVFRQTYSSVECIVVDDASTDHSATVIRDTISTRPHIMFIPLQKNVGNCRAFNIALAHARGKYVIDFSTDDVMMPERVEKQVKFFESLDEHYGIVFTDSTYIDEHGKEIRHHYDHLIRKGMLRSIPQGDVFKAVLQRYFISSPTMMIRRKLLDDLQGYDERLVYEDFDLWVRGSRNYWFGFLDERLTRVRKMSGSMSTKWYTKGDKQLLSTYAVCLKAKALIRSEDEKKTLVVRARFELRQSVFSENGKEARLFLELLKSLDEASLFDVLIFQMSCLPLPLAKIRTWYHQLRYT